LTRIGGVDQILLLLREQLQRSDTKRGRRSGAAAALDRVSVRPLERVRALAALDALEPDELRRTLVRGLLAENFGDALDNDVAMQAVVDDVVRILADTPGGPELIDRAIAQLKEGRA